MSTIINWNVWNNITLSISVARRCVILAGLVISG